jgi:2-dehydropantoate 2-reductase
MQKDIFIIGSGAIGKALAVILKNEGRNVTLLRGSVDEGESHTEKISVVFEGRTELAADVTVSTLGNFPRLDGIIVLTNKSYGNGGLSRSLKDKTGQSPLVILQNGLGVEQPFIDNGFPEIYRCVLFVTSQLTGNQLRFKPVSVSPIGLIKGDGSSLSTVVTQLNSQGFQFREEANIQTIIWKKAITNSVFNSVCPLLDIDNGVFHRQQEALAIAKRVIAECVAVANAQGINLNVDEVVESLLMISRASDGQLISTLQDIKNKRETEIATLNFEIVRIAKALKMEGAVAETRLLGELTKLRSDLTR